MRITMIGSISALAIGAVMLGLTPVKAQEANEGPQAKLANSLKDIRLETINTRNQLEASVNALDALTTQRAGDLRPAYDKFAAEVKNTHGSADQTAARVGNMETASKDYFGAWQTEVSSISNESLRKRAQRRLDDVRSRYDKVIASLRQAGVAFKPFLSDLDDVQKTLANDVTAGGVNAVRSVARSATYNEKKVLRYINEAINHLSGMEDALSTQKGG